MSTAGPDPIAALDFDETCLQGDISEALLADLEADGDTPLVAPYRAAVEVDPLAAYVALTITLLEGRTEPKVRSLVLRTLDRGRASGHLVERESMRELVWAMHRHGWQVFIVTASPTAVVRPVAQRFGIHPDQVLGMTAPSIPRAGSCPRSSIR